MSPESYVAEGRCSACGCLPYYWTVERILEAARTWATENGRTPRAVDWSTSSPYRPTKTRVTDIFGTWNKMIVVAGLTPHKRGGGHSLWAKDTIADAMLNWVFKYGEWPEYRDWESRKGKRGMDVPGTCAVIRLFGSWSAAKRFAGWRPDGTAGKCKACGGPRDQRTPGCHTCKSRHWHRTNVSKNPTLRSSRSLRAQPPAQTPSGPRRAPAGGVSLPKAPPAPLLAGGVPPSTERVAA